MVEAACSSGGYFMKKLQTLLAIVMGGALLNAGWSASAQPAKPGFATVIRVRGEVSYSLDKGVHKYPLVQGKFLEAGSTIYTGEHGEVDMILAKAIEAPQATWAPQRISLAVDAPVRGMVTYRPSIEQNTVRIMPNSALAIDKLTTTSSGADTVSDTELDLQKGGIYASVKKLSPAAQYLVKTPTGIAGVRGTEFNIILNPDGSIKSVAVYRTHADDGLVLAITKSDGSTQTLVINEGQIWEPGNPNPLPITNELKALFQEIFAIERTPFWQILSFDFDHTRCRTSSDYGF